MPLNGTTRTSGVLQGGSFHRYRDFWSLGPVFSTGFVYLLGSSLYDALVGAWHDYIMHMGRRSKPMKASMKTKSTSVQEILGIRLLAGYDSGFLQNIAMSLFEKVS